jgi:hypothetical protein
LIISDPVFEFPTYGTLTGTLTLVALDPPSTRGFSYRIESLKLDSTFFREPLGQALDGEGGVLAGEVTPEGASVSGRITVLVRGRGEVELAIDAKLQHIFGPPFSAEQPPALNGIVMEGQLGANGYFLVVTATPEHVGSASSGGR